MRLCISSVVTTVLLVSGVIALCCPLLHSERFLRIAGTRWVKILFGCILVRIFLPMEFPYTYTFNFTEIFTTIRRILTWQMLPGSERIRFFHVLIMIWIVGICFEVWRNGLFYRKMQKAMFWIERKPTEETLSEAKALWKEYPELKNVEIKVCALVDSPVLFGLCHPVILLPEMEYTSKDLKYILSHEALHMRGRDTLWKMLIDIVCIVLWWNPLFRILRKEMIRIIEINNDLRMTEKMAVDERADYMECLCKVARNSISQKHFGAIGFSSKGGKELQTRFRFIANGITGKRWVQKMVCIVAAAVMFGTSCVIFEPIFSLPEKTWTMTSENTYVVEENGEYKVYIDGKYLFTSDALEYFPENLSIYKEGENE